MTSWTPLSRVYLTQYSKVYIYVYAAHTATFYYDTQCLLQYSLRESSNFQLSCVNISFFPCNKASKLMWILRGTRRDHTGIFVWVAGNFLKKLEDGHTWCMKFAAFTWRSIFSREFQAWNYWCLCVAEKVAWITHESCMCLTWKVVFSVHLPASRMQRNIRAFPQAILIFSCAAWIFHFFYATKPPNLRGTRSDHAGILARVVGNFLKKIEDGHAWCMNLLHLPGDRSFQENFACETTDTFVLREKLCGSCLNPACVCMKSSIFRAFTCITLGKKN